VPVPAVGGHIAPTDRLGCDALEEGKEREMNGGNEKEVGKE